MGTQNQPNSCKNSPMLKKLLTQELGKQSHPQRYNRQYPYNPSSNGMHNISCWPFIRGYKWQITRQQYISWRYARGFIIWKWQLNQPISFTHIAISAPKLAASTSSALPAPPLTNEAIASTVSLIWKSWKSSVNRSWICLIKSQAKNLGQICQSLDRTVARLCGPKFIYMPWSTMVPHITQSKYTHLAWFNSPVGFPQKI